jgi:hypothetical protein
VDGYKKQEYMIYNNNKIKRLMTFHSAKQIKYGAFCTGYRDTYSELKKLFSYGTSAQV